ncbi:MAG: hypothetical protein CMP11_03355 [Zetaproteobacteria bacterium]|nr:hypothetical protein [Pseudobdellovibrionaceae bacterium]|tara:strand:- start:410 stop:832 length:423 start_codon:yes stop_codon:yes gene_type:complete
MKSVSQFGDQVALTMSLLCAVHCFATPILVSTLPAFQALSCENSESIHFWMMLGVVPSSAISLLMGCRKHKEQTFLIIGFLGLSILIFASIWGHELFGCCYEKYITLLGSSIISFAHINNYFLCRHSNCKNHNSQIKTFV